MMRGSSQPLVLHADRFFDSDPAIRKNARALYEETRQLPLICPHGHVDPGLLAENTPFPEPVSLLIIPDHYVLRMLYSRGVPLERLFRFGMTVSAGVPGLNTPENVTMESIRAMNRGPTPYTRRRPSMPRNGPRRMRSSTIRRANAGVMPGSDSICAAVATSRSSRFPT